MRLILLLALFAGCASHRSTQWDPHHNTVTQKAHEQVLKDLSHEEREPASPSPDLGARLSDLQKLKPGKFEVYVFPKVSQQHRKSREADDTYLGRPQAFEVSVIAENPCKQFIQGNLFATLKPATVFPSDLAQGNRRCAIIEVTDKRLRSIARSALKRDDLLKARLFLDDQYRVHATDRILFDGSSDRTVRVLNDESSSTSGLSLFPIDLPSENANYVSGQPLDKFKNLLDGVATYQIRRHHMRNFSATNCQGGVMSYRDEYGAAVKVGWCKGLPWPTYAENAHYFSVTQPLSVGGVR